MHDGVMDGQGRMVDAQPRVGRKRQKVCQCHSSGCAREVVPAEVREAQVGLTAKHGVEVARVTAREHRGQRTAGDEQTAGKPRFHHLGDAQRVTREADHRVDAHDVRLIGAQLSLQPLVRAESAIENPGLQPEPAKLRRESGHAERREEHLGA